MTTEIHAADPLLRRWALVLALLLLLAGALFLGWLQWLLAGVSDEAYEAMVETFFQLKLALGVLTACGSLALLATGLWLALLARASLRDRRWPPIGARLPQPTAIVVGQAARRKALEIAGASALCLLSAVGVVAAIAMLWQRLP